MQFNDIYWLMVIFLFFLPYEVYAAFSKKKGDTLSENVWDWFAIKRPWMKYGRLRRFILWAFLTGLVSHFIYATTVVPVIVFGVGVAWSIFYHYKYEKGFVS